MTKKKYKLVLVDWWDHTADASWVDNPQSCKAELCTTVGWLVHEDKKCLRVANAITQESGVGGISVILNSCIDEIWEIEFIDDKVRKTTFKKSC